jgi:hypothetical protein
MIDLLNLSLLLDMQRTIVLGISLPRQIITRIDAERGDIPRSKYVLRVLERGHELKCMHCREKKDSQESLDHDGVETAVVKQSSST